MKKIILFIVLAIFLIPTFSYAKNEDTSKNKLIYFYSNTCNNCIKLKPHLENLKEKYDIEITEYNTIELNNSKLLTVYEDKYKVKKDQRDIIPKIFFKNKYYTGFADIRENIEDEIKNNTKNVKTPILDLSDANSDNKLKQFLNLKVIGIITAGFLNGLSPCSISMILLFLSLLLANKKNILKLGFIFCLGKFIAFLLMGTILYKLLSQIDFSFFNIVFKVSMIIFLYILAMFNLYDFFAAKNESYNKIKLQLPTKLRKFNNRIISLIKDTKYLVVMSFLLSILVSTGEFLCTGQIYLATIITIFHTNPQLNILSLIYLIIYNISLISPLILIILIIYKTNSIFALSDFVRRKLHIIKLLNILIYIVIAIIIVLN
jgi:thiol-disulfide isomerase/thioredoxin